MLSRKTPGSIARRLRAVVEEPPGPAAAAPAGPPARGAVWQCGPVSSSLAIPLT